MYSVHLGGIKCWSALFFAAMLSQTFCSEGLVSMFPDIVWKNSFINKVKLITRKKGKKNQMQIYFFVKFNMHKITLSN